MKSELRWWHILAVNKFREPDVSVSASEAEGTETETRLTAADNQSVNSALIIKKAFHSLIINKSQDS